MRVKWKGVPRGGETGVVVMVVVVVVVEVIVFFVVLGDGDEGWRGVNAWKFVVCQSNDFERIIRDNLPIQLF